MLPELLDRLEDYYGLPSSTPAKSAWEMILWENVAYLADDERRARAFSELREQVGLAPEQIAAAPDEALLAATRHGMLAEQRIARLRECAEIALDAGEDALSTAALSDPRAAKRLLKRFPGIGDPGVEKILLFTGVQPSAALESNGLRVLLRLGYGREAPAYSRTYRSVQEAIRGEAPADCSSLVRMHQLLRQHGKELCRATAPDCGACPLRDSCSFACCGERA